MKSEPIKTINGLSLYIEQDIDPPNPRKDWDHLGTMACWHRRYNLGDEQPSEDSESYMRSMADRAVNFKCDAEDIGKEHIAAVLKKYYTILTLHLYDHSGITMNTSGFSCPWDSGRVGIIYLSLKDALLEWKLEAGTWDTKIKRHDGVEQTLRKWAEGLLESEVEEYDQYLTGDVWGFVIEDEDGEHVDSCSGFFGQKYAEEQGVESLEHAAERKEKVERETAIAECCP